MQRRLPATLQTLLTVACVWTGYIVLPGALGCRSLQDGPVAAERQPISTGSATIHPPVSQPPVEKPGGSVANDAASAEKPWAKVWSPTWQADLAGLDAAAQFVAQENFAQALRELEAMTAPTDASSREWLRYHLMRLRLAELPAARSAALASEKALLAQRKRWDSELGDVVDRQRAALWQFVANDAGDDADKREDALVEAIEALTAALKSPWPRYGAELALDRARLWIAQQVSPAQRAKHRRRLQNDVPKTLANYPNYPKLGELKLAYAKALVAQKLWKPAQVELEQLVMQDAGSPAAKEALEFWKAQSSVRGSHLIRPRFSFQQDLERAQHARESRYVEWSRAYLDKLVESSSGQNKRKALLERAQTAYRERDYAQCIHDAMAAASPKLIAPSNPNDEDFLQAPSRCLQRGGHLDVLVNQALAKAKQSKRKTAKAAATWDAIDPAFLSGDYVRTLEILDQYEKLSSGHASDRAWMRGWLNYRLNRLEPALAEFRRLAGRSGALARKARYFAGKTALAIGGADKRKQGISYLREVLDGHASDYYGLWARHYLVKEGESVPPPYSIAVDPRFAEPCGYLPAAGILRGQADDHGELLPPLRRAAILWESGYLEEARREVRAAGEMAFALRNRGKVPSGIKNEDVIVGASWGASWAVFKIKVSSAQKKAMRVASRLDKLDNAVEQAAYAVHEPYRIAKHGDADGHGPYHNWLILAYRHDLEREAKLRGLEPTVLWALMYTESRFRRHVVSGVGARGALQIMPWTGRQLAQRLGDTSGFFDPDTLYIVPRNVELAAYYVDELVDKFGGQAPLAYASYNGGPSNVARWLTEKSAGADEGKKRPLQLDDFIEELGFDESYRYTKRVMEVEAAYRLAYTGQLPQWNEALPATIGDNIDF